MDVRGVTLDVGGVLQVPDSEVVRRAVAPLGIEPSKDEIYAAHYIALSRSDGDATAPDYDLWMKHYAVALGVPKTAEGDAIERLKEAFSDGSVWSEVVPGAHEALDGLEQRELRIAIISNTMVAGTVAQSLASASLCQVGGGTGVSVAAIVDSSELGFRKPDPRIFQASLEAMDTAPEETIHVGDSLSADVRGALSVGIQPIHYDPLRSCPDDTHQHLDDLRQLADVLDKERARPS